MNAPIKNALQATKPEQDISKPLLNNDSRKTTDFEATALQYSKLGWRSFPCHSVINQDCTCGKKLQCSSIGKHPRFNKKILEHGLKDATVDPELIAYWNSIWPDANIGIVTGVESGFFVVDVDTRNNGIDNWNDMVDQNGGYPDTVESITGSGGRHILFRYPSGHKIKSDSNVLAPGVDVKGDGGYFIAPPSINANGRYEWEASSDPFDEVAIADAPQWLIDKLTGNSTTSPITTGVFFKQLSPVKTKADGSPVAEGGRNTAAASLIGTYLQEGHDLKTVKTLIDQWNSTNPVPLPYDELNTTIASIATKHAREGEPVTLVEENQAAKATLDEDSLKGIAWEAPLTTDDPTPDFVLNSPFKMMNEVAEYIGLCGPVSIPTINLVAALGVVQAVTGRKYYSEQFENSTNFYIVLVASTSGGKDSIKKGIQKLLSESGLHQRLGKGRFTSSAGIETALLQSPCQLSIMDEFGDMLNHGLNDKGGHAKTQFRSMKMAFSDSTSILEQAGYSLRGVKPSEVKEFEKPCLYPTFSLIGLTTENQFFDALNVNMVDDGFLNRILVVGTSQANKTKNSKIATKVPDDLIEHIKEVYNRPRPGSTNPALDQASLNTADKEPAQYFLPFSKEAMAYFESIGGSDPDPGTILYQYQNASAQLRNIRTPLSVRWREIAMRMATGISAFEGFDSIEKETLEWCWNFVKHYGDQFVNNFSEKACATEYQKTKEACLKKIREYPNGISKTNLNRCSPFRGLKKRDRNEVISDLIESGFIIEISFKSKLTSKKPQIRFLATGESDD